MGNPLKNPPVYVTLAQVRFNPILKLAEFLPSIQESFRRQNFVSFETHQNISIQVTIQDSKAIPQTVPLVKYLFGNAERTHKFILDNQSLTIQSTNYVQFENFSSCFLNGLEIIDKAVQLAYTERTGLRYLDRVMPQKDETIEKYLADKVQGLTSNLGGKPVYSFTEAMNEVDNIKLISRVAIQDGPLAFPPDLQPLDLVVEDRFVTYTGKSAVLDNDGYIENREKYSKQKVYENLNAIHKVISTAFKATATPYALKIWNE